MKRQFRCRKRSVQARPILFALSRKGWESLAALLGVLSFRSALRSAQPDSTGSSQWLLDQSTLTYHMSHPMHEVDGVSHAARGKGICHAGWCDFLIAVPVKTFDSGDTNRDLHMIEATRGARVSPDPGARPLCRRPKPRSNGFTPISKSSSPARRPLLPGPFRARRSRAGKCVSPEPFRSPVPTSRSTVRRSSPCPSKTRSLSAST